MLSRALQTYSKLDRAQDVEWIHMVLSFLKTYIEHNCQLLVDGVEKGFSVETLVQSLRESVEELETGKYIPITAMLVAEFLRSGPP